MPAANDAAKVASAKITQSWPQSQLPSIISPIPARTTISAAGRTAARRGGRLARRTGHLLGIAAPADDEAVHLQREPSADPDDGAGDVDEQEELVPVI